MREAEMFAIDGELQRERARKDLQAERDTLKADCHELLRQRDQLLSAAKAAQHKIQMTLRVSDNEGTEWGRVRTLLERAIAAAESKDGATV